MSENMQRKANRLVHEKSPYLLQHAYNPVEWYPWSKEAFKKAKEEDKPIFLSIGYSTCHWCHVMERESFEDKEVAEILNDNFVCIKVDKEERMDVDSVYMDVCQAMTGSGGWPLTIIMTSDKKPFFSGTYFPKVGRYGMMGLIDILHNISQQWKNNSEKILSSSEEITMAVKSNYKNKHEKHEIGEGIIDKAFEDFSTLFESQYGGFGTEPKFPTPHNLYFLLRYYKVNNSKKALDMVTKTLDSMYKGGIFDHIGFGFSRYSTDRKWLVPHFEKMLYDNALLSKIYAEAYVATGKKLYKEIGEKIFNYILRDMKHEEGGFYSAEDADSEGVEGKFYVWDYDEVNEVLGEKTGELFCKYYGISKDGNFEGKNILNLIGKDIDNIESDNQLKNIIDESVKKLFRHREKRIHPHKDDKILTSWNGLMIAALSYGGRIFNNSIYIQEAENAVSFIFKNLVRNDGRLLARYRKGHSGILGYLDDYAFLIGGLIELYEATFKIDYLKKAIELNEDMYKHFWDKDNGGFFLYGEDSEELIWRPKGVYDGAIPSGNSVAVLNMLKLSRITGNLELEEKSREMFKVFGENVKDIPSAHAYFLIGLMFDNIPGSDLVISGDEKDKEVKKIIREINNFYAPFTTIILNNGDKEIYELCPYIKDKESIDNKTTLYICENFSCKKPMNNIKDMGTILELLS